MSIMLISIVAGDLQNDLAYVRKCHRHFSSMCDIGVVFIAKMFRRSARIAARSLPYEASTTNAAESVEDNPSSDENEQESVIQFDSFAFAKLPRHNPYSGFVPPRTLSSQTGIPFLRCSSVGYGVHHINHNHGCSSLANLRLLTVREHQRITADHRRAMAERGGK